MSTIGKPSQEPATGHPPRPDTPRPSDPQAVVNPGREVRTLVAPDTYRSTPSAEPATSALPPGRSVLLAPPLSPRAAAAAMKSGAAVGTSPGVTCGIPPSSVPTDPVVPDPEAIYDIALRDKDLPLNRLRVSFTARFVAYCEEHGVRVDIQRGLLIHPDGRREGIRPGATSATLMEDGYVADWVGYSQGAWNVPTGLLIVDRDAGSFTLSTTGPCVPHTFLSDAERTGPAPHKAPRVAFRNPWTQHGEAAWVAGYRDAATRVVSTVTAQIEGMDTPDGPCEVTIHGTYDMTVPKGKVPTLAAVQRLCATMSRNDTIPHAYIFDGCYARAHLVAAALRDKGYNVEKLFVSGDLGASNAYCADADWAFHVAPLVFVDTGNGHVEPLVIDLSFNPDGPMRPDDWVRRFIQGSEVKLQFCHARQVYPPGQHATGVTSFNPSFAAGLAHCKEVLKPYRAALEQLKARNTAAAIPGGSVPPRSHRQT